MKVIEKCVISIAALSTIIKLYVARGAMELYSLINQLIQNCFTEHHHMQDKHPQGCIQDFYNGVSISKKLQEYIWN